MTEAALDASALQARLGSPNGPYAAVRVVPSTGSTNADLVVAGQNGAADRSVLIAEEQTAGRGRRSRSWASPASSGLYLSVLLRPEHLDVHRIGWLPLLTGLAAVRAAATVGAAASLKWPNDLLIGDAKAAGILAEMVSSSPPAVVVGIGMNVAPLPADAAAPGAGGLAATSLADAASGPVDRTEVAIALLDALAEIDRRWRDAAGDVAAAGLLDEYRAHCGTLGRRVSVQLTETSFLNGTAVDVDGTGALLLRLDDGIRRQISAGDVVHLRAVGDPGVTGAAIQ